MNAKTLFAVVLSSATFAGVASADPHDYVCGVIDTKRIAAELEADQCMECVEASAYFVENPLDNVTFFETCDTYGGIVDWIMPIDNWEPWEEVPYLIDQCLIAMDRAERLNTLYSANCP